MIELLVGVVTLIPLDVPVSPSPVTTQPVGTNGFAAAILGGFFGLGIIVLAAFLLSLKPKRAQPPYPRRPAPPQPGSLPSGADDL